MSILVTLKALARMPVTRAASIALFGIGLAAAAGPGCDRAPEPESGPMPSAIPDPGELKIEDLKPGKGDRVVKTGDKIKVNYVGRLLRGGSQFDENKSKEDPFPVTVGEGVIEGWSQGLLGMKEGGKRKLTIPSKLAYGDKGQEPKIPPNAPLVFEIELIKFDDGEGDDDPPPSGSSSASPPGSASASGSASAAASAAPSAAPAASVKATAEPTAKPKAKKDP